MNVSVLYTMQLSGDTIYLSHPDHLPLRNVRVAAIRNVSEPSAEQVALAVRQALVRLDLGDDGDNRFALAVQWRHGADYQSLRALCAGIVDALPGVRDRQPLLLVGRRRRRRTHWRAAVARIQGWWEPGMHRPGATA